jgi:hypothetical protein
MKRPTDAEVEALANLIPLAYDPDRDPYANPFEAARAIFAEGYRPPATEALGDQILEYLDMHWFSALDVVDRHVLATGLSQHLEESGAWPTGQVQQNSPEEGPK